jgi:CMP-N,N'-diacetyllegionaminic acid synthase
MSILITICVRGGSKGIPGKNIKKIADKPLIEYTISIAKAFADKYDAVIALSTDSSDIIQVASNSGLLSNYIRPDFLATDQAGKVAAIEDLLRYEEKTKNIEFEYILDLDVTSPLRTLEDLEAGFAILKKNEEALNLFSVNNASRNPYFNMVEEKADGFYNLSKTSEEKILSRQSAPKVYELNGSFYFYRRKFFDQGLISVMTSASLIYVMPHMCFDLDHLIDFYFLEYLIQNDKLDFKLA